MKVVIRLSEKQEAKALPIILRQSPGMVLPDRTYILSEDTVSRLRAAGIRYRIKPDQPCTSCDNTHAQ
jgi:hypothetical protein